MGLRGVSSFYSFFAIGADDMELIERGSHTSFSLVEPAHTKPSAKLRKNTPPKIPYIQPTCCDIQYAAGVPAKSANAIGRVMGK